MFNYIMVIEEVVMESLELDITNDEIAILIEVLESYLSDLRMEIANTDSMEYREKLKTKKTIIIKVLTKLGAD